MGAPGTNVPRASQIKTNPTGVFWSDGVTLFDGFLWVGLSIPTGGQPGTSFPYPWLIATTRKQRLPQFNKILIVNGAIDQTAQLLFNQDINPPGTQYYTYWFTSDGTLITPASGAASPFTVTLPTTIIDVPSLTIPTGGSAPVPQSTAGF